VQKLILSGKKQNKGRNKENPCMQQKKGQAEIGNPISAPPIPPKKNKKKKMRGLIWNCRGIKKSGVSAFLNNLIFEHKFHFIGLQETQQADIDDKTLRLIDPAGSYLWKS